MTTASDGDTSSEVVPKERPECNFMMWKGTAIIHFNNKENAMFRTTAIAVLFLAAVLEAGGDALMGAGLHRDILWQRELFFYWSHRPVLVWVDGQCAAVGLLKVDRYLCGFLLNDQPQQERCVWMGGHFTEP